MEKEKNQMTDTICALIDPENFDNVYLEDVNGEMLEFEQVATIPQTDAIYVFLARVGEVVKSPRDYDLVRISADAEKVYLDQIKDEAFSQSLFERLSAFPRCEE